MGKADRPAWMEAAWAALSDRLLANARAPVCIAFSGGSDSLALLRLAKAWADDAGRPVIAFTVDHGLNAQSAAWTASAAATAARFAIPWRGLVWTSDKPCQGLPAAARAARHALLAEAARDCGASVILMGHTADDVAESALIRANTLGHGRLRPWAPSPVWPQGRGVFLLRPLLVARRVELRTWLAAQGCGWLEDPSNFDPRFARSRARAELAAGAEVSAEAAPEGVDAAVAGLACEVEASVDGRLVLSRRALAAATEEAARRVVSAALLCAGGGGRPPRGERLSRLLGAISSGRDVISTLAGAKVCVTETGERIFFARNGGERARGGLAALRLAAGERGVFDGRFDVQAHSQPVDIAALAGRMARLDGSDRRRLAAIPPGARAALPAVIDEDGGVRLPAPFGEGPATARLLVGRRFTSACGLVEREAELAEARAMAL